ncbi:MAG TPA: ATP-grasp domain-containing protein, partial [Phototrophicaceae bacterium]|nr:ATP-grasp domain-containing protein [Phototrophicaceae bacterium]
GEELLREAKREGAHVILLTENKIEHEAWPRESIDQIFLMPDLSKLPDVIYAVAYLSRGKQIDRIIPLDEYDVEMAAFLREHLRIPGMGITHTKRFRDKLIMRQAAAEAGIKVPEFTPVINYDQLREYMARVPAPWMLKPRLEAGAMGIKRVNNDEELWRLLDVLGDQQSYRVMEQYIPGDVYHVDALTWHGKTVFASVQKYGQPPLNVSHEGGIFTTLTVPPKSAEAKALKSFNLEVIKALGLSDGVTHGEYIRSHATGEYYFLEMAARVGGANIADLIEATTGINPWREWARIEIALARGEDYKLPEVNQRYGGLLVSLAKQEYPDLSGYTDVEIVWRMDKKQHAGLIVACEDQKRVQVLVENYKERFVQDFLAWLPPKEHH